MVIDNFRKLFWSVAPVFVIGLHLALAPRASACPDINGLLDRNCDRRVEIVAFGDSITYGRGDSTDLGYPGRVNQIFPNVFVYNLGVPGENTSRGRARSAQQFPQFPNADFVIVLEGTNDYFVPTHSVENTKSNIVTMKRSADNFGAIPLLGNLTAVRRSYQKSWVSSVNAAIKPYRDINFYGLGEGIISGDLLHPNDSGYQSMAELVAAVLQEQTAINRPADSDGDGMYDFAETQIYGSNPFVADTDGDGLADGAEAFTWGSSPLLLNTDGDDFSDNYEVTVLHSNPADPRPTAPVMQELEILSGG